MAVVASPAFSSWRCSALSLACNAASKRRCKSYARCIARGSEGSILNGLWMRFLKHEKWWKIGFHNVSYGKICGTSYINVTFLILLAAVKQQNSSLLKKSWKLPTWKTIHRAMLMIFTSPGHSRDDQKDFLWGSMITSSLSWRPAPKIQSLNQFSPPKTKNARYTKSCDKPKKDYIINTIYIYIYIHVCIYYYYIPIMLYPSIVR